jgi:hypothetical protein
MEVLILKTPDPRDCKSFPIKTGFRSAQVPFKTGLLALLRMIQLFEKHITSGRILCVGFCDIDFLLRAITSLPAFRVFSAYMFL